MNTAALPRSDPNPKIREVEWTYLNGTSSLSRSTERMRPYHGQMTHICDEYEMKDINRDVPNTLRDSSASASDTLPDGASLQTYHSLSHLRVTIVGSQGR